MRYLITDTELIDYISGNMDPQIRKRFEAKAVETGQTDLLLYVQLADYASTGTSTDDIIGEDTFLCDDNTEIKPTPEISFPRAAELSAPKSTEKK